MKIKKLCGFDGVSISFVNDLICIVDRNDVGKCTVIIVIETFFNNRCGIFDIKKILFVVF